MESVRWLGLPGIVAALGAAAIHNTLVVSVCLSLLAAFFTYKVIPLVRDVFVKHGRFGKDLLKDDRPITPESMGVVAGVVYFICMFIFIPVPFVEWFIGVSGEDPEFPHHKFAQFLGGLLALFSMLFLGFADDVLDIRWRVKIWLPLIASMPLLMVYCVTYGGTDMLIPLPLRPLFPNKILHLGVFYYGYMASLAIFCTNAINILAGINGVEGGQSLVIAVSIVANDILQIHVNPARAEAHMTSLYFLIPFIGATLGYLKHNWFPARAFGGDTYAYFAGMTFAVVGILGNFSKTVLLFMIPQVFNFLYSCPQIFQFVECPRHRMPKFNPKTNQIEASRFSLQNASRSGRLMVRLLELLRLANVTRDPSTGEMVDSNNLTLINLVLVKLGPMPEERATVSIMAIQSLCTLLGFIIRYQLVHIVYNAEDG
ncbi:hypothetical protein HK104_011296 [Borealophlyctis nickersoniae]|nr:hypothetical protein HK104_011296 [Borealophlyctis nickersoniae]